MPGVVVDTHALVWFGPNDRARRSDFVPVICLVELSYLGEKGRLPRITREILIAALDGPGTPYELALLNRRIAGAMELVAREEVPGLPDRIVAATACESPLGR